MSSNSSSRDSSHDSLSLITENSIVPTHHPHHSTRVHDTVIALDDGPRTVEIAGMTAPADMAAPGAFTAPENMVADDEKKDFERTVSLKDIQHLPHISDSDLPPYLRFLTKLRDAWTDCPDVHLQFSDLAYSVQIPVRDTGIRNFLQTGLDGLKRLDILGKLNKAWGPKKKQFTVLAPMSGRIAPGTMTLVLTPPGHGKSTFLKALAGRLEGDSHLSGQVLFNGLTGNEAKAKGVHVHRLVSYIGQTDIHFPVLTVRETLKFAAKNAVPDIHSLTSDPELVKMDSERADMLMGMLGLSECADTIIGNDMLRGVSGGQRRRSTLGEMLITNARVIMMDEVSTGLDAAVTYHIFHALQKWAHLCRGSIVTALLQPTPEVYNLFDDIILLREGEMLYHGPRAGVRSFFAEHLHLPIPEEADEGGFVVDYLNDPKSVIHRMKKRAIKQQMAAAGLVVPPSPQIGLVSGAGGSIHLNEVSPLVLDRKRPDPSLLVAHKDLSMELPRLSIMVPAAVKEEKESEASGAEEPVELLSVPRDSAFHPSKVPTTTPAMLTAYRSSHYFADSQKELKDSLSLCSSNDPKTTFDPTRWSEYSQLQFARPFPHSFWHFTKLDMVRQAKLTFRNKAILIPRMIQAVVMGLIFSTLFFQLGADDYASKFGLLMYCVMFGAFSNLSELPIAAEARNVVTKQLDAGFFPPMPFIISNVVWTVPKVVAESILFGTLMYWIPGFTMDGGRFLYFIFILSLSSLSLSAFFRTISFMTSNPDVARQMDFPFILIFVIFGGFLISSDKIPNWLIWIYWLNPLNWSVTSLAQNEFLSPEYSDLVDGGSITRGVKYLNAFSIRTDSVYRFSGIAYLIGFFAFSAVLSAAAIAYVRGTTTLGTRRTTDLSAKEKKEADGHAHPEQKASSVPELHHNQNENEGAGNGNGTKASNGEVAIQMSAINGVNQLAESSLAALSSTMSGAASASRLPFVPVTLAWRNIRYTVTVGSGKTQKQLVLLKGISGFSKPGTMTALMGSSGAGKTTLMDVIAGRKTTGVIEGDILINGNKVQPMTFNKITGYVEQQDLHMGMTTVREALQFSAKLRLPATVDHATREAWIDEVMALVGLTKIAGRLVGDAALPGLSPGQLKLLTIGVELVANPSVLFLDEPTSGLDAPSAFRVMSAVKRITQTGRSVLCTIHQPSAELFFMFDRLLLLRSGGEDVYFADIGENGRELVQYFESVSEGKAPKCPEEQNPANWMLDVIGAGVASAEGGNIQTSGFQYADYVSIWRSSSVHAQTAKDTKAACDSSPMFDELISRVDRETYVNEFTRYWEVQKRFFVMHWRNPPTNLTRVLLCLIIGLLLGLIYLQIGTADFQAVQSLLSAIFMGIAFPASVSAASAFPSFFRQRAVYYRESTIGMYTFYSFNAAMAIVELPYIWFGLMFFVIPFYFMIGLAADGALFFKFYLVLYLMAVCYSSLSQLWMALAPSQIATNVLNGFFMSMFFMFGGVFIRPDAMPKGWKWFYYIDPIPKALISAAAPQFYCDTSVPGCPQIEVTTSSGTEVQYVSDYIADTVSGTSSQYGEYIGYLILTILIIRLLNLLCLKKISHLKR